MKTYRAAFIIAVLFSLLASGCVTKPPLIDATYDAPATIKSGAKVTVTKSAGSIEGSLSQPSRVMPIAGAYVSVPAGEAFDARFGAVDQEDLRDLLGTELIRIGTIGELVDTTASKSPDVTINLYFERTQLVRQNLFYIIDVTMLISGNGRSSSKQYHVDVYEECSTEERWHNTYYRNKVKAKKILLGRLIPDIEEFLKGGNIKMSNPSFQRTAFGGR